MSKKQLIMETALDLFAKQGFEATSVQQITDRCGISKGAFYLSFKSKDELILALIDYFMMQVTSDIDYIVRVTKDEELLYQFYFSIYQTFHNHSQFAKVILKEPSLTLNKELILKLNYYDKLIGNTILMMIERLYGEAVKETKYDLLYSIKGFMSAYSQLFIYYNIPIDLNMLVESLVEKTNLLAKHTTVPFVSKEMNDIFQFKQPMNEEMKEQILEMIENKLEEMEESIEKESLVLLKGQLLEPTLSRAVVRGLLENIRNQPHCKWIAYLLRQYFE